MLQVAMMDERDPRVKKLQDLSWGLGYYYYY